MNAMRRLILFLAVFIPILFIGIAIAVTESTLRLPRTQPKDIQTNRAKSLAAQFERKWSVIELPRPDGVLKAWYFHQPASQRLVVLFHGQGDNGSGMLPYAEMFLRNGYDVLAPDSRAHGSSGGRLTTYGIQEIEDVSAWLDWIQKRTPDVTVFGLGESMGAAILLQSLRKEQRWKAVVAESSFSDFRTIAVERLSGWLPSSILVDTALFYARVRYGLDFTTVNPADAVKDCAIPILLIHGSNDKSIAPHHSATIAANNYFIELWEVPNTGHTAAIGTHSGEFETRVLSFFEDE